MVATDIPLDMALTDQEMTEAGQYIGLYSYYSKCKRLEIPFSPTDFDPDELDIIYTFLTTIEEVESKRRGKKSSNSNRVPSKR